VPTSPPRHPPTKGQAGDLGSRVRPAKVRAVSALGTEGTPEGTGPRDPRQRLRDPTGPGPHAVRAAVPFLYAERLSAPAALASPTELVLAGHGDRVPSSPPSALSTESSTTTRTGSRFSVTSFSALLWEITSTPQALHLENLKGKNPDSVLKRVRDQAQTSGTVRIVLWLSSYRWKQRLVTPESSKCPVVGHVNHAVCHNLLICPHLHCAQTVDPTRSLSVNWELVHLY
jgi:hypothetical protein